MFVLSGSSPLLRTMLFPGSGAPKEGSPESTIALQNTPNLNGTKVLPLPPLVPLVDEGEFRRFVDAALPRGDASIAVVAAASGQDQSAFAGDGPAAADAYYQAVADLTARIPREL